MCVLVHVYVHACVPQYTHQKSEDKFMKSVLSFHIYTTPRNEHRSPSHLTDPSALLCQIFTNFPTLLQTFHPCASQILLSSLLNNAIELCNPHHGANIIFISVINFIYLSFFFVVNHGRFAISRAYHKINKQCLVNGHKNNSF